MSRDVRFYAGIHVAKRTNAFPQGALLPVENLCETWNHERCANSLAHAKYAAAPVEWAS